MVKNVNDVVRIYNAEPASLLEFKLSINTSMMNCKMLNKRVVVLKDVLAYILHVHLALWA
jgi:hypothetical protein